MHRERSSSPWRACRARRPNSALPPRRLRGASLPGDGDRRRPLPQGAPRRAETHPGRDREPARGKPARRRRDRRRAARGAPIHVAVHRLQAQGRPGMSEPLPKVVDVRMGATTDALTPVSAAERSLAAGPLQWLGLVAVAFAAVFADQITKHVVSDNLSLDEGLHVAGPFSIHHVQNSGIAFGLFASATVVVIVLTAVAVGWMLLFFARSGARHPILPAALGLVIGGSLSNLVDRVRIG